MTNHRVSSYKKKTTSKKKSSRTGKVKTTWADPTVPIRKISKTKLKKKQLPQLSCWWFG